jgi:hypothetical protein
VDATKAYGDIYELVECSHICTNEGSCSEVNGGEGTDSPTSSTDAQSTTPAANTTTPPANTTTPAPTTSSGAPTTSSDAPTSTVGPPVCGDRPQLIVINGCSFGNASIMEYSIEVVYSTWTLTRRSGFNPTKKNIKDTINLSSISYKGVIRSTATVSEKINMIIDISTDYSANNLTIQDMNLMSIPMKEGTFNGKMRDFVDCGKV